jgi:hypothetical protein
MRFLALLFITLITLNASAATEHALDAVIQGGYNDNIFLHQDGSVAKKSSLFSRLLGMGWFGWDRGDSGDKIYLFGVTDTKLVSAFTQASSSYFDLGPGYRSYHLDEKLELDSNFHFSGNVAGDKAENEDILRSRNVRTGAPYAPAGSFASTLTQPSSFFGFALEGSALYKFPDFRLGPVLQITQKSYQRVRHQDNAWRAHLRGEIPIGHAFLLAGEAGRAQTTANVREYNRTDLFALVSLNLDLGNGLLLTGDYQYEMRVFNNYDREDTIKSFHAGAEKSVLRDFALLFDVYVFDNNSNNDQFRYTANMLTLGLKWMLF